MNDKTVRAIIQYGIDQIDNGWEGKEACDLHHYLYNEDYFVVGTAKAEEMLAEYGTFKAINDIKEYEQMNFGEVTTDLSDPEKVINMLAYIKGEEALQDCKTLQDNWDNKLTKKQLESIKKELEAQL